MATAPDPYSAYGQSISPKPAVPVDWVRLAPQIAEALFDSPNKRMSKGSALRFGTNGSVSVNLDDGQFYDHENKYGGGMLDLIRHVRGCDVAGALSWLEGKGMKERDEQRPEQKVVPIFPVMYEYRDEQGAILSKVRRTSDKRFLQLGPDRHGGFHSAPGCMTGVRRVPYRLPELLAADPARVVFVVEGEKDADRLALLGLVATCNAEGALKFRPELVEHFAGRRVVIIPDNDKAGRDHAADVAAKLDGTAAVVTILELAGIPEKGDVSNWLDDGATVDQLEDLTRAALDKPNVRFGHSEQTAAETFPLADLALWSVSPASPKGFIMPGFVPDREITLLTGAGGANKSTFGQQLATCVAASVLMLGVDVVQGAALYVTAEDDEARLHWVQTHICKALGVDMAGLAGKLHLSSVRGRLRNELATFDGEGKLKSSPAFAMLRATVARTRAKLLVLDNAAHMFAGNENDRSQVTAFVNLLYSLCVDFGTTIILVAHSNKAGDTYSGSTAWLNAVRSQIVVARPENSSDPDERILSLGKANYARPGEELRCRWHDFALCLETDLAADVRSEYAAVAQDSADDAIFLTCLRQRTKQRRAVSEKLSPSFAPTQFAKMAESKRIGKRRLEHAMERLFCSAAIERAELWKGDDRKLVFGLRETAGNGAVQTVRGTRETVAKSLEYGAGNAGETHIYTTYSAGAPQQGAAPAFPHDGPAPKPIAEGDDDPAVAAFHAGREPPF